MGLLSIMEGNEPAAKISTSAEGTQSGKAKANEPNDKYDEVKKRIHVAVVNNFNQAGAAMGTNIDPETMSQFLNEELAKDEYAVPRPDRPQIVTELLNDILGYGPIQELIDSPEYSEVMVNGPNQIYVERKGKLVLTDVHFRDNQHLMNTIDRIVSAVGRHVDEASPMVDARLKDGSRVNVIIPPLSLVGPVLTIRKFGKDPITAKQLIEFGSLTPNMLHFLEACVKGKLNIIVSGGTGSGKTTLLNVLSSYIPGD